MPQTFYIKNMVCDRCIMAVEQLLSDQGLHPQKVALGEVLLDGPLLTAAQLDTLDAGLLRMGFERVDGKKARLIEKAKAVVIGHIHHSPKVDLKINWSTLLAEETNTEYHYLSSLFSSIEGITLEQYIIRQKIERVKELLFYDELTLGQIADKLGYSSVAHLSSQFKRITGDTPSAFKNSRGATAGRRPLDKIG